MALEYYIVDTETTGLDASRHEMTEISIIRCSDRHQLTKQVKCLYPERAHPKALEKTERTLSDLLVGESKESMIESVNEFLAQDGKNPEHRCMVAHNAPFDRRFIHAAWVSVKQEFPANHWMCTMAWQKVWSEAIGRQPENKKLHTVLGFHGIKPLPGIHDAGSDARNTYLLWRRGMDEKINHLKVISRLPHKIG